MFPGNGQRGDVHGDAAVHVQSPDQKEAPTSDDRPGTETLRTPTERCHAGAAT